MSDGDAPRPGGWATLTAEPQELELLVGRIGEGDVRLELRGTGDGPGAGKGLHAVAALPPEEARRVARELATTASQVEPREIEAGPNSTKNLVENEGDE
jgi:hypothetical protein